MAQLPKYYIVEAQALPEVFLKVAEAKWLLETGEVATVNLIQQCGLARFMGIEDGLHLCLGGIELGKQRLNARNKALLLG